jgi:hypothetical protein
MANTKLAVASFMVSLLAIVFIIGAFHTKDWVYYEDVASDGTVEEITWSLFRITDGPDGFENFSWDCYKKIACEQLDEAETDQQEDAISGG